ncbi:MAG: hypothetical protein IKJ55_05140 [Clostridia bacterium]|nr:hypothetical protein [Clostridia bacterium]
MMQELIDYVAACPAVSLLKRGVTAGFSGASDLTITEEPAMKILYRYRDGSFLVQRLFRAELYLSHTGDTDQACDGSMLFQEIQKYILQKPYPKIPEGKIVAVLPQRGGNQSKTGIFEGLSSFKFAVNYKTKEGELC